MEIKKPAHETQKYHKYSRPMSKMLHDRLVKLGLNRKEGETPKQQALRCKAWLRKNSSMLNDKIKEEL